MGQRFYPPTHQGHRAIRRKVSSSQLVPLEKSQNNQYLASYMFRLLTSLCKPGEE